MKHLMHTLKLTTVWGLVILLFMDPVRPDFQLVISDQRLSIRDFYSQPNFWTSKQAESLAYARRLGHTPEQAIVPLIFSPQGLLLSAREYNSRKFCHLRWFYTDLETFHRVTRERTAVPAYAKVLTEYKGEPVYAYDPYVRYQQTREEETAQFMTDALMRNASNKTFSVTFSRLEEKHLGFESGDILIRPNVVLWGIFGSATVPPDAVGSGWGHAAGISRSSKPGADINGSLEEAQVIEAWGPELPREHQIRETKACVPGKFEISRKKFPVPNDYYWCKKRKGSRFRLRMHLTPEQCEAIVAFWRQQLSEQDGYSAFVQKHFRCSPKTQISGCNRARIPSCATEDWANSDRWYCSLLIWQAYHFVLGVDIDANGGAYVFPNDIIRSSCFDNTTTDQERRVRF
jgi:hypothetical protein